MKDLEQLPKAEIHLHLDGSLRIPTLLEYARKLKIDLPSWTESGLEELVFKPAYKNLFEYLQGFAYTVPVLQDEEALYQVSKELMEDCAAEGTRYLEVRFAPQLLLRPDKGLDMQRILSAVHQGFSDAAKALNQARIDPEEPEYRFGLIMCIMRHLPGAESPYYGNLAKRLGHHDAGKLCVEAGLELSKEIVALRDKKALAILGIDLAGSEKDNPARHHQEAVLYAKDAGLGVTIHAGEAAGSQSIQEALELLKASRIGHGLHMYDQEVPDMPGRLKTQSSCIEVCPSSNLQTSPNLSSILDHPVQQMLADNLAVCINTDNRLVSHTSLSKELNLVQEAFKLNDQTMKEIILNGFKYRFPNGESQSEAQKYLESVNRWYDKQSASL